jgi:hypothetical protein
MNICHNLLILKYIIQIVFSGAFNTTGIASALWVFQGLTLERTTIHWKTFILGEHTNIPESSALQKVQSSHNDFLSLRSIYTLS